MELVSYHDLDGKPGFKIAIQVVDEKWYLYLGHFWHQGWAILDVTDPERPECLKFIPGPDNTETNQIQVADGIMVTGLQQMISLTGGLRETDPNLPYEEGIYIWDVKDPVNPKRLGHWETGGIGTHRNHYEGGRYVHCAAAAPGFEGMIYRIVDIVDPANPVEVGRWWLPEQWEAGRTTKTTFVNLHGPPYPKGDRAYLAFYTGGGMVMLDISDITLPRLVSQLEFQPPLGTWIACHTVLPLTNRDLVLAVSEGVGPAGKSPLNYAGIIDVSDDKNPRLISLLSIPEPPPGAPYKNFCEKGGSFGPHNFHHAQNQPHLEDRDDRIYLTYFNAGLRVYDIGDPYLPKEIAYYVPPDPKERRGPLPRDLVVSSQDVLVDKRGYIYMTDHNLGLNILRCTV